MIERYCEGSSQQRCLDCPIPIGDEASTGLVNRVMQSLDPNELKYKNLVSWVKTLGEGFPGVKIEPVLEAVNEIRSGNCVNR